MFLECSLRCLNPAIGEGVSAKAPFFFDLCCRGTCNWLGKVVLQKVNRIALISFDLEQVVFAEAAYQFSQPTLGKHRISNQLKRGMRNRQASQPPTKQRRLIRFVVAGGALSDDGSNLMDKRIEHVQWFVSQPIPCLAVVLSTASTPALHSAPWRRNHIFRAVWKSSTLHLASVQMIEGAEELIAIKTQRLSQRVPINRSPANQNFHFTNPGDHPKQIKNGPRYEQPQSLVRKFLLCCSPMKKRIFLASGFGECITGCRGGIGL